MIKVESRGDLPYLQDDRFKDYLLELLQTLFVEGDDEGNEVEMYIAESIKDFETFAVANGGVSPDVEYIEKQMRGGFKAYNVVKVDQDLDKATVLIIPMYMVAADPLSKILIDYVGEEELPL